MSDLQVYDIRLLVESMGVDYQKAIWVIIWVLLAMGIAWVFGMLLAVTTYDHKNRMHYSDNDRDRND